MKRHIGVFLLAIATASPLATFAAPTFTRQGDTQFKRIEIGETQQDVRDSLGRPSSTTRRGGTTHYAYNYLDTWGMRAVYYVDFDSSGRVEKTSHTRTEF